MLRLGSPWLLAVPGASRGVQDVVWGRAAAAQGCSPLQPCSPPFPLSPGTWDLKDFVEDFHLGHPVAATQFLTKNCKD